MSLVIGEISTRTLATCSLKVVLSLLKSAGEVFIRVLR